MVNKEDLSIETKNRILEIEALSSKPIRAMVLKVVMDSPDRTADFNHEMGGIPRSLADKNMLIKKGYNPEINRTIWQANPDFFHFDEYQAYKNMVQRLSKVGISNIVEAEMHETMSKELTDDQDNMDTNKKQEVLKIITKNHSSKQKNNQDTIDTTKKEAVEEGLQNGS